MTHMSESCDQCYSDGRFAAWNEFSEAKKQLMVGSWQDGFRAGLDAAQQLDNARKQQIAEQIAESLRSYNS
jgi:hypothetical protein